MRLPHVFDNNIIPFYWGERARQKKNRNCLNFFRENHNQLDNVGHDEIKYINQHQKL